MRLNLLQQNQTSANNTIVVQVTVSCDCSGLATANACCTNLTHFNLGYSAFERLARPDYGLMNLEYRSVLLFCIAAEPLCNLSFAPSSQVNVASDCKVCGSRAETAMH